MIVFFPTKHYLVYFLSFIPANFRSYVCTSRTAKINGKHYIIIYSSCIISFSGIRLRRWHICVSYTCGIGNTRVAVRGYGLTTQTDDNTFACIMCVINVSRIFDNNYCSRDSARNPFLCSSRCRRVNAAPHHQNHLRFTRQPLAIIISLIRI